MIKNRPQHRQLPPPETVIRDLVDSKFASPEDLKQPRRDRVVARIANRALESSAVESDRSSDKESCVLSLLAQLPGFMESQVELNKMKLQNKSRPGTYSRIDFRKQKRLLLPFNETLCDITDHYANLSVDELLAFMTTSQLALHDQASALEVKPLVWPAIQGMRHEVALEGALCYVDGVEDMKPGSADDDLDGIDLHVQYKSQNIELDAKASVNTALDCARKKIAHGDFSSLPVWSGFTEKDFQGKLRVTDQASASRPAAELEKILDTALRSGNEAALHLIVELYEVHNERRTGQRQPARHGSRPRNYSLSA